MTLQEVKTNRESKMFLMLLVGFWFLAILLDHAFGAVGGEA